MAATVIELPPQPTYGAVELKGIIKKSTLRGFLYTIGILAFLLIGYILFVKISAMESKPKLAPVVKLKVENLAPPPSETDVEAAPPPQEMTNTGPAARAGTPNPVPDAMIKADMKDFATVDVQDRASSVGGDGLDNGGFAPNIEWNPDQKIDVQHIEKEPEPDEFIAVEKEPDINISELQSRIVYPEMAKRAGIEGRVIMRVLVGKDGKPKKTLVEYTDSEMLNKAAEKAVMQSVFTPGIQNKQPVTCWVSIPITFKLR